MRTTTALRPAVRAPSPEPRTACGTCAATLRDLADLLPHPVAVLDPLGRALLANDAFRALAASPEGRRTEDEVSAFARALACGAEPCAVRALGGFELRARRMETTWPGQPRTVLVVVHPSAAAVDDAAIRARWGLTRTQARVARLLAEGRCNGDVARAMHISPHTARHHTGQVLAKLGIVGRAQVAARLAAPTD